MTGGVDENGNPLDPDANAIIGLLADADRRRLLAAFELGASTLQEAASSAGLADHRAAKALGKLLEVGVVVSDDAGMFAVRGVVFARAARQALTRPPRNEHAAEPIESRRILDTFVRDGRLVSMPTAHHKRLIVLEWLAQRFEPGDRYLEVEVNVALDDQAEDPATLRRALVDEGFLDRAGGTYWRIGGRVDVGYER